jgi:hypothetical protein
MKLAELIRRHRSERIATATPAIPAIERPHQAERVAEVAVVAVATRSSESPAVISTQTPAAMESDRTESLSPSLDGLDRGNRDDFATGIREMAARWGYSEDELAWALEAAQSDPDGWQRLMEADKRFIP